MENLHLKKWNPAPIWPLSCIGAFITWEIEGVIHQFLQNKPDNLPKKTYIPASVCSHLIHCFHSNCQVLSSHKLFTNYFPNLQIQQTTCWITTTSFHTQIGQTLSSTGLLVSPGMTTIFTIVNRYCHLITSNTSSKVTFCFPDSPAPSKSGFLDTLHNPRYAPWSWTSPHGCITSNVSATPRDWIKTWNPLSDVKNPLTHLNVVWVSTLGGVHPYTLLCLQLQVCLHSKAPWVINHHFFQYMRKKYPSVLSNFCAFQYTADQNC